jgi:hypothetical protein
VWNRAGAPGVTATMTIRATLALALVLVVAAGCTGASSVASTTPLPSPNATGLQTGIGGVATAGPVCPVEKNPPDPACAPRPVEGAIVVFRDAAGAEVARTTTAADGTFFAELPAGIYVVTPQPAKGLLGTPGPESVTVTDGATVRLDVAYDTGIR